MALPENFKKYLNQTNFYNQNSEIIDEAFNVPLKDNSDIDSFETKQDKNELKKLLKYLDGLGLDDIPMVGGAGGSNSNKIKIRSAQKEAPEIKKWIKDNLPSLTGIGFGQGSVGKDGVKINENTQEMMVAALVLNKVKGGSITESEAVDIINEAKKVFNKIDGASQRPELLEQFTGNFDDLATAISSSDAILKVAPNPVKVFWTGKGWNGEIAKYNPPIGNIKDYNSSDIVVKNSDGVYHGFSLKKKKKSTDVDPTLINKPITGNVGILKDILGSSIVNRIEKSKQNFFDYVIFKHYKQNPNKIDDKTKKKMIGDITQQQMGVYLKDPKNIFFRRVYQILSKHSEEFTKSFIELLFRTKMKDIEDAGEFKFYLLTGIGRFVKGNVVVEKAEMKDTPQVISTLTRIFNSKLTMKPTPGKKQAWEPDAGAAKVFFSIFSDSDQIIDLEVRYKGSYTANPQFQAVATPNFKKIFKEDYFNDDLIPLFESKAGKNLHLEHIEDEILNFGIDGGRASINFLQSLRDMLAGNSSSKVDMTVKWDGAPAIFAGEDPSDGKFFVAKKSVFNVNPKLYKTQEEIKNDPSLKGALKKKFEISLREFSKLGIKGKVLQGDLMFTKGDITTQTIDGEKYHTFQPNTIVYAVPVNSELGQKISSSKVGVVWHTTYSGSSLESMYASFGADISGLKTPKTVWMDDAEYRDVSGLATMNKTETNKITRVLSEVGKTFRTIKKKELDNFMSLQNTFTGDLSGANIKTYYNSFVREGEPIKNASKFANDYLQWVEDKFDNKLSKIKSDVGKQKYTKRKEETLRELKRYVITVTNVVKFQNLIIQAKELIVNKLNEVKSIGTFIKTKSGFKAVNPEGYVAIDRLSNKAVKLVDRMEFSFNNFTAIKNWDS